VMTFCFLMSLPGTSTSSMMQATLIIGLR
jgi:hypothetical protein